MRSAFAKALALTFSKPNGSNIIVINWIGRTSARDDSEEEEATNAMITASSSRTVEKYRKLDSHAISRFAFARLALAISLDLKPHLAWEQLALDILQEAAESHAVDVLHSMPQLDTPRLEICLTICLVLAIVADHAGRTTVQKTDIYALQRVLGIFYPSRVGSPKKHTRKGS
jgi:histone H3/H4